ncbi:MAG: C40 family peptidase [Candidatus Nanopelagicales bacterium]
MRSPIRHSIRRHAVRTVAATALAGAVLTGGVMSTAAVADTQLASAEANPVPLADAVPPNAEAAIEVSGRRTAAMRRTFQRATSAAAAQIRARIVTLAKAQVGDSYRAGHAGPDAFDCSGLTSYVYKQAAGIDLPHRSNSQWRKVKRVRYRDSSPGDLVFFFRGGAHHVGIYIGHGKMVDAVDPGKGVRISPITGSWYSRSYSGMGRLIQPA